MGITILIGGPFPPVVVTRLTRFYDPMKIINIVDEFRVPLVCKKIKIFPTPLCLIIIAVGCFDFANENFQMKHPTTVRVSSYGPGGFSITKQGERFVRRLNLTFRGHVE